MRGSPCATDVPDEGLTPGVASPYADIDRYLALAVGRPRPLALPAGFGIVDAAVHPFGVETRRIRHAEHHPLAVLQREQTFGCVAGVDRDVGAESKRVVPVDPGVVAGLGAAR